MREPAIGSYRDADGARHELVVRATNEGDWEVLDVVGAETSHVVDRLAGDQDGRPQAEAIARDYLSTPGRLGRETGPTAGEPIPEQGGSDAHSHRRSKQPPRPERGRGAALPRAAR